MILISVHIRPLILAERACICLPEFAEWFNWCSHDFSFNHYSKWSTTPWAGFLLSVMFYAATVIPCAPIAPLGRKRKSAQHLKPFCALFCFKFKVLLAAWFCFELKMKASIGFHSCPVKQAISLSLFILPLPPAPPWSLSASVHVYQSWMS